MAVKFKDFVAKASQPPKKRFGKGNHPKPPKEIAGSIGDIGEPSAADGVSGSRDIHVGGALTL